MERLLSNEEISKVAYKHNPTYKGSGLEYTRKPNADREIAKAQDLHTAREIFDKLFEQFGWLQGEWKSPDRIMTISLRQWQEIKKEYGL